MRRKGFTLVELLVVIAIIALLMSILMPALAQVRRLAQRIMCGTHLSAIGKAMIVYSEDNELDFPRSGGRLSKWSDLGKILKWDAVAAGTPAQRLAFGPPPAKATITSCFFLLVKYSDGIPKMFNCGGDIGASIFKLSDSANTTLTNIKDAWDFGNGDDGDGLEWPGEYVSYSYHMPFTHQNLLAGTNACFALQNADSSASPLCADRNPYLDKNAILIYTDRKDAEDEWSLFDPKNGFYDASKVRNSASHQREGQNVLYVDGHVEFEKSPNCGIQNDYIWMNWQKAPSAMKTVDKEWVQKDCKTILNPRKTGSGGAGPITIEDAFLVNEYNGKIGDYK